MKKESRTALVSLLVLLNSAAGPPELSQPQLWAHGGALAQPEERAGAAWLREPGFHRVSVTDASIIFSASRFQISLDSKMSLLMAGCWTR